MSNNKPSDFTGYPWNSVLGKSEAETIARNIMTILRRTGNEFRLLDWDEYEVERLKDGNFSNKERPFFDQVILYFKSAYTAALFSPTWETK